MIQRIQTIYLLLAGLSIFSLMMPFMSFAFADITEAVSLPYILKDGVFNLDDNILLFIMVIVSGLIALVAIFMYKNRGLQMRITAIMMIISLGILITAGIIYYQQTEAFPANSEEIGMGIAGPILTILFGSFANRAIRKDDKLVKSMDRLR